VQRDTNTHVFGPLTIQPQKIPTQAKAIRVIPVLVDDASMPRASDLPDDLKLLVRRNAVEVSHTRFSADSERLIATLERVFEKTAQRQHEETTGGQDAAQHAKEQKD